MSSKYPGNKDAFKTSNPNPDVIGAFVTEAMQEFIVVASMGLWGLLKSFVSKKAVVTIPMVVGLAVASFMAAKTGYHIRLIHDIDPIIFTYARLKWLTRIPLMYHVAAIFCFILSPIVLMIGIWMRSIRTKFQRIFLKANLTNGLGDTPKLIRTQKLDKDRVSYIFDANGVGISEFLAKSERIEAHFKTNVESIKHADHKGQIAITFTKQVFPDRVSYLELTTQKVLPRESFYLGQTIEGPKVQGVAELPHMLIAGTTGSGKSVFFKQALLGLLESSPHLQMYLIDLKGGLEMIDFAKAPNVQVIKSMDQAVHLLRLIEREMKDRFRHLEESSRKQIVPEEDRRDRIVVAVDEASVLYMNRSRHDPDYQTSLDARQLADSISKLSRAAAIHLLLATQKLDRSVIPTSVSENISGRMAFRANSLQGSMVVLGCKDASELPEIPGRAIWAFGTQKIIIQAPFVDEKTIRARCEQVAEGFKAGKRKLLSPMIGKVGKKQEAEMQAMVYQSSPAEK